MANIGVFCSSLDGEKIFSEKAIELGALLAKENYSLVYGGGKLGLLGELATVSYPHLRAHETREDLE